MKEIFLARKQQILEQFNFDIVVKALRATRFGWGAHVGNKTDAQVEDRARRFAASVMDSAIEYVLGDSEMAWSGCGGFKASAWPNGNLLLEFVLADAGDWLGDVNEDIADAAQSTVRIGEPLTIGRRRILKLHEET